MVAVIAIFTWLHNAITTHRQLTLIGTAIGIVVIAVFTLFRMLHNAITTTSGNAAVIRTRVVIVVIAIITLFTRINDTIATMWLCGD